MDKPKRILLFDLDGTLLRDDKTLSEYTRKTLIKCKENGYLIGISTSRGEQNCLEFLKDIEPDILISSAGALVRVNGTIVYTSTFSVDETRKFIETARNICGMDCRITVDTLDAHYSNYKIFLQAQDKSWENSIDTDFYDFKQEALKICVLIPDANLSEKLCESFLELDSMRFSDGSWYKFTKGGVTKEKAILAMCEACNITVSEIIAFGDDYVDIGMLKLCGLGVAMGNAIQKVKDIADDITLSNEEDGVAVYLEKWMALCAEDSRSYSIAYEQTKGMLKQKIEELFVNEYSGHDYWHSVRVCNNAEKIAKTEKCDKYIVMIAALLHDADDEKLFKTVDYENARRIMSDCNMPEDVINKVIDIISAVSFKGTKITVPNSIEGKIVQDADRLDAMGAIGIARAFTYGGNKGRAIYNPNCQPNIDMNEIEYRTNIGTTINHFYEKLFLLKDRMNTDCAKSIAQKRDHYMREYLKEFYEEWEG